MSQAMLDLNRHGVLRAPLSLWCCTALLLRNWVLLVFLISSWLGPPGNISWVYGILSWPMLLIESPMLFLVCAGVRRVPEARAWARWLWRHGRELMSVTAAMSIGWALWFLAGQDVWSPVPERLIAAFALIDGAILVAAAHSPHYRAVFEEFPSPAADTSTARPS